jgi:hypothetical protein
MTDIPNPEIGTEEEKEPIEAPAEGEQPETPETPQENPQPADPPAAPAPQVDYETKFKESARENEVLRAKIAESDQRAKSLTINPTEQELRDLYPDWDNMLPSEKTLARNTLTTQRQAEKTSRELAEMRAEQAWQKDLKNAVKTFPALKGREEDFEAYVFKPTHKGVSIEALAKAFLYDATKDAPPAAPTPQAGLERGGTGKQDVRPKPKLLTAQELKNLREKDHRAYKDYVQKHPEVEDIE